MKKLSLISLMIIASLNCSAKDLKDSPKCSDSSKQSGDVSLYWQLASGQASGTLEDICRISVSDIRPTQFAVGLYEVKRKSTGLTALSDKKLENYLQANPEPIVIGPHGEFFIIDHHHLARALYESKIEKTYGIILENWKNSSEDKFWSHMKEKNWVYLVNQNGERKTINDLVKVNSVKELKDDPNRSLAGQTRCKVENKCVEGQWLKQSVPFIEFLWAEHFRKTSAVADALKKFGNTDFQKVTDAATAEVKRLKGVLPANEAQFNN